MSAVKKTALVLLGFLFVLASLGTDWMAPSKFGDKGHLVGGKTEWTYHEVDGKNPITWKTTGPRTVRLLVRAPNNKEHSFTIYIDGEKYKDFKFKETVSDKYTISIEEGKPTQVTSAFTQKIRLGKGSKTIEVRSSDMIYARLNNLTKQAKYIAPSAYDKSLALITGDTKTTYYTATSKKPVIFEYTGSGTVTVWTRLAFSKSMKGTQHYTILVEEEGKEPRRMKLETSISGTSVWENDGGVIPGKAKRFELKLGSGKHRISFKPDGTPSPYCALRFKVS